MSGAGGALIAIDIPNKAFLRPTEVATLLDVGRSTIYQWIDEGKLAAVEIGERLRIPRSAILSFIKQH